MKFFNLAKGLLVIPFLCILLSGTINLHAQTYQGTTGYETQMTTVSFSDIVQYDLTHPVTGTMAHVNPRKNPIRPEGDERGIHRSSIVNPNPDNGQNDDVQVHQTDHVQTVSPAPTASFNGITYTNNVAVIPPDTYGAIGPNHIMETLNSQVKIMDKTGAQISIVYLSSFWSSLGEGNTTFDPKIVYDPYSGRYIFTTL